MKQFLQLSTLLGLVATSTAATAALPKANEYKSGDCSGPINYPHHGELNVVTMDDTTHSVYTSGVFDAYSIKTGNGGSCTGYRLGTLPDGHGCFNLDNYFSGRIECLQKV